MDVYVVNLNGAVIGAGADAESAMEIADRGEHQLSHHGWATWRHESGSDKWWRNASGLQAQTITRVPLAGYTEMAFPLGDDTSRLLERDRSRHAAVERMNRMIVTLAGMRFDGAKLRCGSGAAWDLLRRGLDQMATYPSEKALPDSVVARLAGIDVVLDPDLPPDMMRLGSKIFVVTGDSVIALDETLTALAHGLFTSRHG